VLRGPAARIFLIADICGPGLISSGGGEVHDFAAKVSALKYWLQYHSSGECA
jgi:hypothetical protein